VDLGKGLPNRSDIADTGGLQSRGVTSTRTWVKLREPEMRRIASSIVTRLEKAGVMRLSGNREALEQRIVAAFKANIRTEEEIELAAERFAESHSRELVGMDRHRILQMVKERIAKERGFTL
jgi:hypothetical protein